MRVSTAAVQQSLLTQMRSVQSDLNTASAQTTTGLKSSSYSDVADSSYVITKLTSEVSQASGYADLAETIQGRVEVYYDSLNDMTDILSDISARVSASLSSGKDSDTGLNDAGETALQSFAAILNTQYEGRYVFAGSAVDTVPVSIDSADYAAITSPSTSDTSYYSGNSDIASAKVADGTTVKYGMTADMEPFEQALRALNMISNASSDPIDEDTLNEALELIDSAVDGIGQQQTRMSSLDSQLESVIDMHTDFQLSAESMVSDLTEVDVAEALVNLDTLSTQLEASYSSISKVQGLSLFDYLK